jgi:hypothetical protein
VEPRPADGINGHIVGSVAGMGVAHFRASLCVLFLVGTLTPFCVAEVVLEQAPWPAAQTCDTCVAVQYGKLEMRLPLADIGKILVFGNGLSDLTIILPDKSAPPKSVLLLTLSPQKLITRYRKLGFLHAKRIITNEQFFDYLGTRPKATKADRRKRDLRTLRSLWQLQVADRYSKASMESLHAYWIHSSRSNMQYVYFVIDGEKTVYELSGEVSQRLYEAILSNLRVVEVP